MASYFVHPSAIVDPSASLGEGVKIWHFCHVMAEAALGDFAQLGQSCFVGAKVRIGARTRVQNHVSVFEGVELEEDVFVGPSAVFTNVMNPRAQVARRHEFRRTLVRRGASIGANATILPGVTLGEYCFVGAGAVVRRDVRPFAIVVGTPASEIGWMSRSGERLEFESGRARCSASGEEYELDSSGVRAL